MTDDKKTNKDGGTGTFSLEELASEEAKNKPRGMGVGSETGPGNMKQGPGPDNMADVHRRVTLAPGQVTIASLADDDDPTVEVPVGDGSSVFENGPAGLADPLDTSTPSSAPDDLEFFEGALRDREADQLIAETFEKHLADKSFPEIFEVYQSQFGNQDMLDRLTATVGIHLSALDLNDAIPFATSLWSEFKDTTMVASLRKYVELGSFTHMLTEGRYEDAAAHYKTYQLDPSFRTQVAGLATDILYGLDDSERTQSVIDMEPHFAGTEFYKMVIAPQLSEEEFYGSASSSIASSYFNRALDAQKYDEASQIYNYNLDNPEFLRTVRDSMRDHMKGLKELGKDAVEIAFLELEHRFQGSELFVDTITPIALGKDIDQQTAEVRATLPGATIAPVVGATELPPISQDELFTGLEPIDPSAVTTADGDVPAIRINVDDEAGPQHVTDSMVLGPVETTDEVPLLSDEEVEDTDDTQPMIDGDEVEGPIEGKDNWGDDCADIVSEIDEIVAEAEEELGLDEEELAEGIEATGIMSTPGPEDFEEIDESTARPADFESGIVAILQHSNRLPRKLAFGYLQRMLVDYDTSRSDISEERDIAVREKDSALTAQQVAETSRELAIDEKTQAIAARTRHAENYSRVKKQLNELSETMRKRLIAKQEDIAEYDGKLVSATKRIEELDILLRRKEIEKKKIELEAGSWRMAANSNSGQVERLHNARTKDQHERDAARRDQSKLREELQAIQTEVAHTERAKEQAEAAQLRIQDEYNQLVKTTNDLKRNVNRLTGEIDILNVDRDVLDSELEQERAESEIYRTTSDMEIITKNGEINDLSRKVRNLQTRVGEDDEIIIGQEQALKVAAKEREKIVEAAKQEKEQIVEELATTKGSLQNAEGKLDKLDQTLEAAVAETGTIRGREFKGAEKAAYARSEGEAFEGEAFEAQRGLMEKIAELETNLATARAHVQTATTEAGSYHSQAVALKREIAGTIKDIRRTNKKRERQYAAKRIELETEIAGLNAVIDDERQESLDVSDDYRTTLAKEISSLREARQYIKDHGIVENQQEIERLETELEDVNKATEQERLDAASAIKVVNEVADEAKDNERIAKDNERIAKERVSELETKVKGLEGDVETRIQNLNDFNDQYNKEKAADAERLKKTQRTLRNTRSEADQNSVTIRKLNAKISRHRKVRALSTGKRATAGALCLLIGGALTAGVMLTVDDYLFTKNSDAVATSQDTVTALTKDNAALTNANDSLEDENKRIKNERIQLAKQVDSYNRLQDKLKGVRVVVMKDGRPVNISADNVNKGTKLYSPEFALQQTSYVLPVEKNIDTLLAEATPYEKGIMISPNGHTGSVMSIQAGEVIMTNQSRKSGQSFVVVEHTDGLVSAYEKLDDTIVKKGDLIQRGDILGHVHAKQKGKPMGSFYFRIEQSGQDIDELLDLNAHCEEHVANKMGMTSFKVKSKK